MERAPGASCAFFLEPLLCAHSIHPCCYHPRLTEQMAETLPFDPTPPEVIPGRPRGLNL